MKSCEYRLPAITLTALTIVKMVQCYVLIATITIENKEK